MRNRDGGAFTAWLRAELDRRQVGGGQFARLIGLEPLIVYRWLNGLAEPTAEQVPRIARELGVDAVRLGQLLRDSTPRQDR